MATNNWSLKLSLNWNSSILKKKDHVSIPIIFVAEVDITQVDPKKDVNDAKSLL